MSTYNRDDLAENVTWLGGNEPPDFERDACIKIDPVGFHYRPPQNPQELGGIPTRDEHLFQTIHMGAAVVDQERWKLVVNGLVNRPLLLEWSQLLRLPSASVTAFHECYGSPIKPPVENTWRIGCVKWTGVPLRLILQLAEPQSSANYVWSDGLDHGEFFQAKADRYQKDLTLSKAMCDEVLVAYKLNGEYLGKKRGGPVRLIVPGWYGTNSTKWLCRLSLQSGRSPSPFTTIYYNELDPGDTLKERVRPCWDVEPNSFLTTVPSNEGEVTSSPLVVEGRAWGAQAIVKVDVQIHRSGRWVMTVECDVENRREFEWQKFLGTVNLDPGRYELLAVATDTAGVTQPLAGRRNHAHRVCIQILGT